MKDPSVKSLYKYLPWSKRTKDILTTERIWYSKVTEFDDPFEGIYNIKSDASPESLIALAIKQKVKGGFTWNQISSFIRDNIVGDTHIDFMGNIDGLNIQKSFIDKIDNLIETALQNFENIGVLSLSEDPRSILMWTHYANQHKGICIEFRREYGEPSTDDIHCRPVTYAQRYPVPGMDDLLKEDHLLTDKVVFTKSIDWAYEKEWRVWKDVGGKLYPTPGPIKSIILGQKWNGVLAEIRRLADIHGAKLREAKKKEGSYDLELITIKD